MDLEETNFRKVAVYIINMMIITILLRSSNNMIQTTVPTLSNHIFNYTQFEVGLLSALFGLASFLTTALLNARLEVHVRRAVFMVSNIIYTISLFLFYVSGPLLLWVNTALSGALLGLLMPNIITAAGLFKDRNLRERSVALYTTALSISLVLGPYYEHLILGIFNDLRYPFLFFAPFGVLASILSPFIPFPEDEQSPKVRRFSSNRGFRVAVLLNLAYNIPFIFITVFAGIYAHNVLKAPYSEVYLLYAVFFTTSFISRITMSVRKPSERLTFLVYITLALTVGGIAIMALSYSLVIFAIAMAILGFPHGLSFPVSLIHITRSYPSETRNSANSYFFSIMMIVLIAGPVLGGFMIENIGYRSAFAILLPAIILISFLVVTNEKIFSGEGVATQI